MSLISSTIHINESSLKLLLQISHISESDRLWQFLHDFKFSCNAFTEFIKSFISLESDFIKCRANLKAVLFPIPGNLEISYTAFSKIFEGIFILPFNY